MTDSRRIRILFICMGNICRSPLAECVFLHKINERDVASQFVVDSAGTGGWHAGHPPDARIRNVASSCGVTVTGRARQIQSRDFNAFDLFICMDEDNREYVLSMGAPAEKVSLLLEHDPRASRLEVPDPYYGGEDGFRTVFDLVDSACDALLDKLLVKPGARRA